MTSSPPASPSFVRLAWHHFLFEVPAAWEVVGHTRHPKEGRFSLSDRRGEVMQIHWKSLKAPPSVPLRLAEVVKATISPAPDEADVRRRLRTVEGWQVWYPAAADQPAFAGRYHEGNKALLLVTFPPHPETKSRGMVRRVLASWHPNDGEERVWAAFGLDVTLPREFQPDEVDALPAAQRLRFEGRRGRAVTVHRFGLLPELLAGMDVPVFFARLLRRRKSLYREAPFQRADGREGVRLSYTTRGEDDSLISNLIDRKWRCAIYAWRCDDLQRLYSIEHHGPRGRAEPPSLPDRVRCFAADRAVLEQPTPPCRLPAPAAPPAGKAEKSGRPSAAAWLESQLATRPLINQAAKAVRQEDGRLFLTLPLKHRRWSRVAQRVLPMSNEKRVELDRFGAEFFVRCDGEHTVEEIITDYSRRWQLSFFEARALVFSYLRILMRKNLIVLAAPAPA